MELSIIRSEERCVNEWFDYSIETSYLTYTTWCINGIVTVMSSGFETTLGYAGKSIQWACYEEYLNIIHYTW